MLKPKLPYYTICYGRRSQSRLRYCLAKQRSYCQSRQSSSIASYLEELKKRGLVRSSYPSNLDTDFLNELK
ncbi:hypothetical protein Y032_0244g3514 [Ancylostoma ceylanicum]|uniref:Uncharacterized protein n=1 Tax=Ancylostoma ceylanicum TaxID=53326 RepID=A0A016SD48_9BILA|nr:hypothetical protein Y032_0244g3514 [Ancylostoma ceylanicum]